LLGEIIDAVLDHRSRKILATQMGVTSCRFHLK
jgi:hypothetical protein